MIQAKDPNLNPPNVWDMMISYSRTLPGGESEWVTHFELDYSYREFQMGQLVVFSRHNLFPGACIRMVNNIPVDGFLVESDEIRFRGETVKHILHQLGCITAIDD